MSTQAPGQPGPACARSVVLVGMMGAGKTAVGGVLARILRLPFRDSDAEIVAAAQMEITEIFERFGEPFFRDRETAVLARLLEGPPMVLATGGGAFLSAHNREIVAAHGVSVWLKVDAATLWARVRSRPTRPLLMTEDPRATLEALAAARAPVYGLADLTVEATPGASVTEMAERVAGAMSAHARRGDEA